MARENSGASSLGMSNQKELNSLSAQIEDLVQRIEFIADPAIRANVVTLVQSLMELHSKGFTRVTDLLAQEGEMGRRTLDSLANDELVGGLLLLYGIHPADLEVRVENAVAKMQQHFKSSDGTVELVGLEDGVVRLRLTVNGAGCGSNAGKMEKTVRDLLCSAAPDASRIEIETVTASKGSDALVQLELNAGAA
jgi:Fe-S cluster biogenesis protein NfuA